MKNRPVALLVTTLLSVGASVTAMSAPVNYTLSGTVFPSGGFASGTFTYDADTNTYSNVNISARESSSSSAVIYASVPNSRVNVGIFTPTSSVTSGVTRALVVNYGGSFLTNAGFPTATNNTAVRIYTCNFDCTLGQSPVVLATNPGNLISTAPTATPAAASIPTLSEWAMIFMASLMGIFGIRRMRMHRP